MALMGLPTLLAAQPLLQQPVVDRREPPLIEQPTATEREPRCVR